MSYLERLQEIIDENQDDVETSHILMDELLCEIIEDNVPDGAKITKLFKIQEKYYS